MINAARKFMLFPWALLYVGGLKDIRFTNIIGGKHHIVLAIMVSNTAGPGALPIYVLPV
ncbi:hypothetical protein D3C86_1178220 [compost metagenome]